MTTFKCEQCVEVKERQENGGTGYAVSDKGQFICYACCADTDRQWMETHPRMTLYVSCGTNEVINWPGTLRFPAYIRTCRVGYASQGVYVSFKDHQGTRWYGRGPGRGMYIHVHKSRAKVPTPK